MNGNTRNVPGWRNAPVPICHGGDYRALTFCCHPGYPLTFSFMCSRRRALNEIGLSEERYVEIKDWFSSLVGWWSEEVCFGSLSYCCMRRRGCPAGRDHVLAKLYGDNFEKALEEYFLRKRVLAVHLLREATNKSLVEDLIKLEVHEIKKIGRDDIVKLLLLKPP